MRKLLLGALLLLSTLSFSQIQKVEIPKPLKETKVAPMGQFWIGADIYEDGALITFQDANFTKITVLRSFRLSLEDFNSLGSILTGDGNKIDDFYTIKTLDSKTLYLRFGKSFGVVYPVILLDGDGVKDAKFPNLTKSQIKKLFDLK
jgi:hypothetical protein